MDKKRKFVKAHPYSIIRHLKISVLLVLITVLQQFIVRPRGLIALIGSLGFNALYVIVILSYYISEYGNFRYRIEERAIHVHSGIMRKKDYIIPYNRILTYVFYTSALSVMFGAAKISVDTPAGSGRTHDVSLYCSLRRARAVREKLLGGERISCQYRARTLSVFLMSAIWSNPVTVSCNCASRLRRSVTMTTEVKIGSFAASCNEARRYAVHAIELDLPEPAECCIR